MLLKKHQFTLGLRYPKIHLGNSLPLPAVYNRPATDWLDPPLFSSFDCSISCFSCFVVSRALIFLINSMSLIKIQNDDFYFNDFCNCLLLSKKNANNKVSVLRIQLFQPNSFGFFKPAPTVVKIISSSRQFKTNELF